MEASTGRMLVVDASCPADLRDAFSVALAEAFDATLLTTDGRLARAHGPSRRIEVLA